MDQNSLIKAIAFVLGVGLVLMLAWGTYKAVTVSRTDFSNVETVETLDSDVALATKIDSLEANWERRSKYHFNVDQDPLYLGRTVIGFTYGVQGFKEFDEGGTPRLSATLAVSNDIPMAIIKYMGKSHVVRRGDTFGDGYSVESIGRQEVVVRKNGKSMTLHNQPIGGPILEQDQQGTYHSNEW